MNRTQYKMIKSFLAMGNSPKTVAQALPESIEEIKAVDSSASYEQFIDGAHPTDLREMMQAMGL